MMFFDLWKFSVFLRIILVILPHQGYIHPDEFFQSQENVIADLFDAPNIKRPWDTTVSAEGGPVRSFLSIYLTSGPPLLLWRLLTSSRPSPYLALMLPRFWMAIVSLLIDWCFFRIFAAEAKHQSPITLAPLVEEQDATPTENSENSNSKQDKQEEKKEEIPCDKSKCAKCALSCSWPVMVIMTHTFSNCIEAILFAFLLQRIQVQMRNNKGHRVASDEWCICAIVTLGFFIRPSFVIFAFIPLCHYALLLYKTPPETRFGHVTRLVKCGIRLSIIGSLIALPIIIIDTIYYKGLWYVFEFYNHLQLVVTPWNFLAYNTNSSNLAQHGISGFYMHALVNMTLMFGVAYIVSLVSVFRRFGFRALWSADFSFDGLCLQTILFSVGVLSLCAHQEARFLLPLLVPCITILMRFEAAPKWRKKIRYAFWAFNIVLGLFMSQFHQAGVLSCTRYVDSAGLAKPFSGKPVVFYHTYWAPPSLLSGGIRPKNIGGADYAVLEMNLSTAGDNLVAMPTSIVCDTVKRLKSSGYDVTRVETFAPHLSTEDWPSFWGSDQVVHCTGGVNCCAADSWFGDFSLTLLHVS